MKQIRFPSKLDDLLAGSPLAAPIRQYADRVAAILSDNKLPFFPDYTDHGVEHVESVLQWTVRLIPDSVLERSREESSPRILCDRDAIVLIGGVLLHDFAMHLRTEGFRELISEDSRFRPLPWFMENHVDYQAERPWSELWEDYSLEMRKLSERELARIIGEKGASEWKFHILIGRAKESGWIIS